MNKTASYDLTIIVPIYNEKDGMDSLEKAMAALFRNPMYLHVFFLLTMVRKMEAIN